MPFAVESVHLEDVKVIKPRVFDDDRGWFMEAYRQDHFQEMGIRHPFLQDNHSRSSRGVIRGLHFQHDRPMGKLMRVTIGAVYLVAVDIRPGSPTLGRWVGVEVSAENQRMMWAPPYFARGFCVLSDVAELQYKCTAIYNPAGESAIRWDDPQIGITWPMDAPLLSEKDAAARSLADWVAAPESAAFAYEQSEALR